MSEEKNVIEEEKVEEKCFSSTEKSPASQIFDGNFGFDVDFGA